MPAAPAGKWGGDRSAVCCVPHPGWNSQRLLGREGGESTGGGARRKGKRRGGGLGEGGEMERGKVNAPSWFSQHSKSEGVVLAHSGGVFCVVAAVPKRCVASRGSAWRWKTKPLRLLSPKEILITLSFPASTGWAGQCPSQPHLHA